MIEIGVFQTLGNVRNAAEQYALAAACQPAAYSRIIALDLDAELLLAQGGMEHACATWGQAMDHMDGVTSARTRKAIIKCDATWRPSAPGSALRPAPRRTRG